MIMIVPSFQITVNSGEPITLCVAGAGVKFLSCGLEPVRRWVSSTLCCKMELLRVRQEKRNTIVAKRERDREDRSRMSFAFMCSLMVLDLPLESQCER